MILQLSRLVFIATVASSEGASGSSALVTPDFAVTISTWITFFILLFLLAKFGWGPFTKALDEREEAITENVNRAEKARNEAEYLLKQYEEKLKNAQNEAEKIISSARERSEEIASKLQNDARIEAQNIMEKAKMTIEGERLKAVNELKSIVSEAAAYLSKKILQREIDMKKHIELVDEAVSKIEKAS